MTVTLDAPAKVNLLLRVGPPGDDGYHPLATLFCALDLADSVQVAPDAPDGPGLDVSFGPPVQAPPELGDPARNLAARAARGFLALAGLPDTAMPRIRLTKRIPAAAGLGGGSSDAAAVLRALDRLYPEAVEADDLAALAARLGADVPFFLLGSPFARATGRGDRLVPVPPLPPRPVVLLLPGFGIATADAYRWLDSDRGTDTPLPAEPPVPESWAGVAAMAVNDLEAPVFARYPSLRRIRDALRDLGAETALMAGSGSSVFGVFANAAGAEEAVDRLRADPAVVVVLTATRSPTA